MWSSGFVRLILPFIIHIIEHVTSNPDRNCDDGINRFLFSPFLLSCMVMNGIGPANMKVGTMNSRGCCKYRLRNTILIKFNTILLARVNYRHVAPFMFDTLLLYHTCCASLLSRWKISRGCERGKRTGYRGVVEPPPPKKRNEEQVGSSAKYVAMCIIEQSAKPSRVRIFHSKGTGILWRKAITQPNVT